MPERRSNLLFGQREKRSAQAGRFSFVQVWKQIFLFFNKQYPLAKLKVKVVCKKPLLHLCVSARKLMV